MKMVAQVRRLSVVFVHISLECAMAEKNNTEQDHESEIEEDNVMKTRWRKCQKYGNPNKNPIFFVWSNGASVECAYSSTRYTENLFHGISVGKSSRHKDFENYLLKKKKWKSWSNEMNNAWGVFKRQWSVEAQFLNQNLRKNYYRLPLSAVVSKCKQWNIELKHYEYQSTTYRGLFPFHPALFRSVRENTFEWKIFVHDCVTYHTHRVIILVGEFVWVYFIASRKWLEMAYKPYLEHQNWTISNAHTCNHL